MLSLIHIFTKDFIYETKSKGLDTIEFNVLEDDFKEKYSAVFCWRVLVHLYLM